MALNLKYQTLAQFATRLRAKYLASSKEECARIARFILAHIANGDFTDAQVRNAFGLTAAQWTTLKAKMQTLVANYDAVQLGQGE